MYKEVQLVIQDQIAIITINRPKALNALNTDVFTDLIQLFGNDLPKQDLRGVIITGSGNKAFVAGADIKEFLTLDNDKAMALSQRGQDIFMTIENFHVPVVAAVNGFALGGGCELAMACHIRVAGRSAKFGQPEVNLGIIPGYGGTQRLAQLVGKGKAMELILTGDMIGSEEAERMGLVNKVCDDQDVLEETIKILNKICTKAPLAIRESISAINAGFNQDGFKAEVTSFGRLADSADFKEGALAFIEKRKPNWKGC